MCEKEKNTMVCKRNSRVSDHTLTWYGSTICHGNERRVVQNFCGGTCEFPDCLEQIVRAPQAEEPSLDVSTNDRVRVENWTYARSLFDQRDSK